MNDSQFPLCFIADNFNIKSINSQENYYRNFSVQGVLHARSYLNIQEHNGVSVAFLGIDACPEPGLKRPFNFIGMLDVHEQQFVQKLKSEAETKADHIVWFAHYPTSCILCLEKDLPKMNLRQHIGSTQKSQVFLCGHLHSMGGFVPKMYTKQRKGYLELELGDWKDNRMYRIAAIDHGMFSFVDLKHNSWPAILVTNPKHAKYVMPGREPLDLMPESSFIRILVFSDVHIDSVKISFDQTSWEECRHVEGPLYVYQWLPSHFDKGVHILHINAVDEVGKEAYVEHPFSLDGTIVNFALLARVLLMLDAGTVVSFLKSKIFLYFLLNLNHI